ncbi:MAG: T9SS type A sorting domain-containing protein [Bacteroidetes bacterium]|nr:T9SS type A sorting domain-containing protein [Bacteroidota bacterium]
MKKLNNTYFTIICLFILQSSSQSQTKLLYFGGNKQDVGHDLVLHNQNIYIAGATRSFGDTLSDTYLLVTDMNGNLQKEKIYHQLLEDGGNSLLFNNSSLYIFGHVETKEDGNICDASLLKIDNNFNNTSKYQYGDTLDDVSYRAVKLTNGNIAFCGRYTAPNGNMQGYIGIIDNNGVLLHNNEFGGAGEETFYGIKQLPNGQIILAGYTAFNPQDIDDIYLVCVDTTANLVWQKTISNFSYDVANGLEISNNNIYLAGLHTDSTTNRACLAVLKLDHQGNTLINKAFTAYQNFIASDIVYMNDQLWVSSNEVSIGGGQGHIHRLDTSLNILNSFAIDPLNTNTIGRITTDGNYIYGVGAAKINNDEQVMLSITPMNVVNGFEHFSSRQQMITRPNPVQDLVTFEFGHRGEKANLSVFNTTGQCVFQSSIISSNSIDLSNLANGLYIAVISGDHFIESSKLVKY